MSTAPVTYPPEVRRRAELLATRGYTPREIRMHLLDEGKDIPKRRIELWTEGINAAATKTNCSSR